MASFRPKSIDDYGGVDAYLLAKKDENNGYDGDDLRKFLKARVPVAAIARLMSSDPERPRSVNTINDWIVRLG
jgi:hypothetical protein